MVKDGTTIIIGGLRKDEKLKTVYKFPLLGDIPFLGAAFRKTSEKLEKDEIVVFITPHIVTGDELPDGMNSQVRDKPDKAIRAYEKALEANPDDAPAHYNLALIYDKIKNDRDKALSHYRRYLDIRPDADNARQVTGRIIQLSSENKIWGEPGVKGIGDKERLGRW